jgi:hypothetical protein
MSNEKLRQVYAQAASALTLQPNSGISDEQLEALVDEIAGLNWVCLVPAKWIELYEKLPDCKLIGSSHEPPLPLILGAWSETSDTEKKKRFLVHLKWARDKSALDAVLNYLKALGDDAWLRTGENHEN